MMTILVALVTLQYLATPFILWRVVSVTRRQRNYDLNYHADILLRHIQTELLAQENRLRDRSFSRK